MILNENIFLLFLLVFLIYVGKDLYLVWFHPNDFIEKTLKRRDKSFPFMKGQTFLFDNDALIKWNRILLPLGFMFVFIIFLLVLMEILTTSL